MTYALVFLAVTAAALGVLALMPPRAGVAVKSRLGALDTLGGALVPVEAPRKRRPASRSRRRSWQLPRMARLALLIAAFLLPTMLMLGARAGVFVACALLLVLGGADLLMQGLTVRLFRRQLPRAVRLLAERLRATNSFFAALEAVEHSRMQPVAAQFGRVRQDVARGIPEEQALEGLAARIPILETEVLAKAIAYHPQKGQRLATSLDGIAEIFEGRHRLVGLIGAGGGR